MKDFIIMVVVVVIPLLLVLLLLASLIILVNDSIIILKEMKDDVKRYEVNDKVIDYIKDSSEYIKENKRLKDMIDIVDKDIDSL